MNNILTGQSDAYTVLGTVEASENDLNLIASYIGDEVSADDVAIVEAVAFDRSKNANGWQVESIDSIDVLGAQLNTDHSTSQKDSFGTIFSARNDGEKKIVKAVIPKTAKTADILSDIKYKVASFTSPMIRVSEWADKEKQVVRSGRLVHLSFVQNPAYGEGNKVLSLAAEAKDDGDAQAFEMLGRDIHEKNVTLATRLAERRNGSFTASQREEAKAKYREMDPLTLHADIIPLLKDTLSARADTTSQRTVSAVTDNSSITSVRRPNPDGLNLNIGEK